MDQGFLLLQRTKRKESAMRYGGHKIFIKPIKKGAVKAPFRLFLKRSYYHTPS